MEKLTLKELRQHVRNIISKRIYESVENGYEDIMNDFINGVKRQNGIKSDNGGNLTELEGIGFVFGDNYDFEINYDVISQQYVKGTRGDGYYIPYEDIVAGKFDFVITGGTVYDKEGNVVCDFDDIAEQVDGGYERIKDWFAFDDSVKVESEDSLNEVKRNLGETTRRQKAVQSMEGTKGDVRTIAILTSENPRYKEHSDGANTTNDERRENLEKDLSVGHFAWFPAKGQYFGKENSYLIYNISLDDALHLGRKYGQQSIIFIDEGHCEYWEQTGDGKYRKTHERKMYERLDMTDADNLFTQISRGFKFQIPFFDGSDENKTELNEMHNYLLKVMRGRISESTERNRRLDTTLYATSGYNRYADRSELYGARFGKK